MIVAHAPPRLSFTEWLKSRVSLGEYSKKSKSGYRKLTWDEITRHDKPGDCWIVVHGKVYDVTHWVPHHPGGEVIYGASGGDCTGLWLSYHPLKVIDRGIPEKYLIGFVPDYTEPYAYNDGFYRVVKERVEAALPQSKRRSDLRMTAKCLGIIAAHSVSLWLYVMYCTWWSALLLAFSACEIGVSIQHDGNHSAFASNTVSWLAGCTLELLGSSGANFRRAHNYGHHTYTNHFELDRVFDLDPSIIRIHVNQRLLTHHRYQHLYAWVLYGLLSFFDLINTFDEMATRSNYPVRSGSVDVGEVLAQVLVKFVWGTIMVVLPCQIHGVVAVVPVWLLYMVVVSWSYGIFFAVNHYTFEAGYQDKSNQTTDWGVVQAQNALNFSVDSWFWTHASGGLNLQVEHHLFPSLLHTRLPEVSGIVRKTCAEFGVTYNAYPSFWTSVQAHYRFIKAMGQSECPKEVKLNH